MFSVLKKKKKKELTTPKFWRSPLLLRVAVWQRPVFEMKILFCVPLGCTQFQTVRPGPFLCTSILPPVYSNGNWVNKCANIGRTRPKTMRPAAGMGAMGAECTVNFEH